MNLDKWYIESGDYTSYWFATGKKPQFNLIVNRTIRQNRGEMLKVITSKNPLYRYFRERAVETPK